ncbi:acetylcholine receptor subunit alpha-1-A-like [Argopecten irradians]|uniref:acetylcholine receptor subunit alpha-1-A-like n=1 Tax=Argopecten irradians TaxID=31199 RepID=UPI0037175E42
MITWEPQDYGDIREVRMRKSVMWSPTFVVVNGADDISINGIKHEEVSILYDNTGMASLLLSGVMTTTCDPDITYYPYDVHICVLQFTTKEPRTGVRISLLDIHKLSGANSNLLWNLGYSEIRTCDPENIGTFIEVAFTIERRPTYLIYNIILPVCLLNFLNLLVFVLPADSGERISFATTMLLTLSVYMTIMSDSIPNTSDPVSILKISLMTKLIISSLIILSVVLTSNIYRLNDHTPTPLWLLRLLCFNKEIERRNLNGGNESDVSDTEIDPPKKIYFDFEHDAGKRRNVTWSQIGRSLDYMMLGIFTLVTVIETIFNMVRIMCRIG